MSRRGPELWYALLIMIAVTLIYGVVAISRETTPESGDLFGHLLGVIGFLLMLMTETLYSLRKRSRRAAHWGSMASWLRFHIVTGLVGPYMVLLHSAWKFNGLAGATTLLMFVIVISGFIGRYIYTSIPHAANGVELGGKDLESQVTANEASLQTWLAANPEASRSLPYRVLSLPVSSPSVWALVSGGIFQELSYRRLWSREKRRLLGTGHRETGELQRLLMRRWGLRYQMASLAKTRRLLAAWHSAHVPIGIALFTAAFTHVGVALYFATPG